MTLIPTPTTTPGQPGTVQKFDTLIAALEYSALSNAGYNFYSARGQLSSQITYADLVAQAQKLAERLGTAYPRNARFGILGETSADFFLFFYACQYAGIIPVPMPMPVSLGGRTSYLAQISQMAASADMVAIAAPESLVSMVREATEELPSVQVESFGAFHDLPAAVGGLRPFGAEDVCYLQYSSGSTSAPKGVVGTQFSVTSNTHGILAHGLKAHPGDRGMSWLPLYHDMGLVGFALAPLFAQISIDYLSASDFARRPLLWLKLMTENKGTLSFSPSFGYELCARRALNGAKGDFDLSAWRVAGIGGDMVRPDMLDRFSETFADNGFSKSAFLPSYGLAEATLAVSFTELNDEFNRDTIDMHEYASSNTASPANGKTPPQQKRTFVACGQALPGHSLKVCSPDGRRLADREVGLVYIKGPSIAPGYFRNAEATAQMLSDDGWIDTGDMGYTLNGELVITGRSKDLILWNGRSIWPQDIEWVVEKLDEVRQGGVAAFSVPQNDGSEDIVTVVECRLTDESAREDLVRDIRTTISSMIGAPSEVVLAPRGSLILTSSGKLSRAKVKAKYLAGGFAEKAPEMHDAAQVTAPITAVERPLRQNPGQSPGQSPGG